ncbi:MAG: fused MFS/spermidine synthase, partial [Thermodesulfobacteriota bacterium]
MNRLIIYLLFLGSGTTGLIYQVLWTRLLTLTFGVTTLAISTVLTCFFGGLALGSFLGGRWVDKRGEGFKWYGYAEIVIGLYALFFLFFLEINNFLYVRIAGALDTGFYGLSLLKFILAALLLIIPTTMMGATLPILSKTLARVRASFAKDVGNLYAINTAGAVAGAVLTAFVLIPSFGIKAVIISVGVINIAMGVVAVYLNKTASKEELLGEGADDVRDEEAERVSGDSVPGWFAKLAVICFALSGFTALAYEVVWTRVLGFILTGTIYAFATVLAVFLTGIAAGSFVVSRYIDRLKGGPGGVINLMALAEVLIGVVSTALIILYAAMPGFDFYHRITSTQNFSEFIYLNFLVSFILLFIPAFLFGTTFPLVCKIYSRRMDRVGTSIGEVYSINTVGGILGSFAGGFLLIQFIGMQKSLVLMGIINVSLGVIFFYFNPFSGRKLKYVSSVVSASLIIIVILLLPANMPLSLHESLLRKNERILYYGEGPAATVMIAERSGAGLKFSNKRLWVNGNMATAAFYEGLQINRFQGVL